MMAGGTDTAPPAKKVAVEYGLDKAFDSQNSPYFTATDRGGIRKID